MTEGRTAPRRAAFLDRDGVINIDRGYVYRLEHFAFVPGVISAARRLVELDFALVVVTNQSGIGRGLYSVAEFEALTTWMKQQFASAGAPVSAVYFCPHHPSEAVGEFRRECMCRKPQPGMLYAAAQDLALDLSRSVSFGDRGSDLLAAQAAGVPTRVLLGTDGLEAPPSGDDGLATASFRSLDEALRDAGLLAVLQPALSRPV